MNIFTIVEMAACVISLGLVAIALIAFMSLIGGDKR